MKLTTTKEKQMKYYIGKIMERNGDFEYSDTYLFATKGDPHKVA